MVNIATITESEILDENIRVIMRQLRQQLADGDINTRYRLRTDISQEQVDKARKLLFEGAPVSLSDTREDPSWITRFNLAIVQGDQEKAIKILVDKETQLSLSWTKPVTSVAKYIIHYKNDYMSSEYNGTGIFLRPDSHPVSSPFEVSKTYYYETGNIVTLDLYGDHDVLREFAVQYVDEHGVLGEITPIYRRMTLEWERPAVENIEKYKIVYTINGQAGYDLILTKNNIKLLSEFEVSKDELDNDDYPMLDLYTSIMNGVYAFNIIAIDNNGQEHAVVNFKLDKQKKPCYNEYCELINGLDDATLFGDRDKINALLWYFNYVFFLDHQNWWNASRMIVERKNRNTIFPKTAPWFFQPILKMDWERQESQDQFVTYLKQSIEIPIWGLSGEQKQQVGVFDVYQNKISDYIIFEVAGAPGDMSVYVSTSDINEQYHGINHVSDLAAAMQNSQIGRVLVDDKRAIVPLTWMPFRSYSREKLTVTRQQENIFIFAYFGTPETTVGAREYTSLDFAPERRIKLEKWQEAFDLWLSIHEDLVTTWRSVFALNPLGLILDVDNILQANIRKNTLNVQPVQQPHELPNEVINKIINILTDDSVLTEDFLTTMSTIYNNLTTTVPQKRNAPRDSSVMTETLKRKERVLLNQDTTEVFDIFRLPYGWDLQRVALVKLNEALLWVDVADFNDIGNPLDEIEIFERRIMVLPKFSAGNN